MVTQWIVSDGVGRLQKQRNPLRFVNLDTIRPYLPPGMLGSDVFSLHALRAIKLSYPLEYSGIPP